MLLVCQVNRISHSVAFPQFMAQPRNSLLHVFLRDLLTTWLGMTVSLPCCAVRVILLEMKAEDAQRDLAQRLERIAAIQPAQASVHGVLT